MKLCAGWTATQMGNWGVTRVRSGPAYQRTSGEPASQPASPHMYTGTCVCPMIALWGASLIARCRLPACLPDLHFVPRSEFPAAPHPAYRSESHSRYESHPFIGTGTSTLGAVLVHSEKSEWTNSPEDASKSFA